MLEMWVENPKDFFAKEAKRRDYFKKIVVNIVKR